MIKFDASELAQEVRVLREELRSIKVLLGDLRSLIIKNIPEGTVIVTPDYEPMKLLTTKQVAHMVGMGLGRITNLQKAGLFPKPIKIDHKRRSWLERDIQQWIANQREAA